jgi:hypothetical protein
MSSLYLDNGRQGFVYLVANPHMPGLVKIGATRKHPLQRAKELSAGTGVPEEMILAYYHDFDDAFEAERLTHERFDNARVNEGREFFRVDLDEAIAFVSGLCNSLTYRDALTSVGIEGGDYTAPRRPVRLPPTPWAELFASFDPDGPPELTSAEQAACRALEAQFRAQ